MRAVRGVISILLMGIIIPFAARAAEPVLQPCKTLGLTTSKEIEGHQAGIYADGCKDDHGNLIIFASPGAAKEDGKDTLANELREHNAPAPVGGHNWVEFQPAVPIHPSFKKDETPPPVAVPPGPAFSFGGTQF